MPIYRDFKQHFLDSLTDKTILTLIQLTLTQNLTPLTQISLALTRYLVPKTRNMAPQIRNIASQVRNMAPKIGIWLRRFGIWLRRFGILPRKFRICAPRLGICVPIFGIYSLYCWSLISPKKLQQDFSHLQTLKLPLTITRMVWVIAFDSPDGLVISSISLCDQNYSHLSNFRYHD